MSLPGRGRNRLRETEIGVLEERKLKVRILADGYQRSRGIETLKTNETVNTTDDKLNIYGSHPREERRQKGK